MAPDSARGSEMFGGECSRPWKWPISHIKTINNWPHTSFTPKLFMWEWVKTYELIPFLGTQHPLARFFWGSSGPRLLIQGPPRNFPEPPQARRCSSLQVEWPCWVAEGRNMRIDTGCILDVYWVYMAGWIPSSLAKSLQARFDPNFIAENSPLKAECQGQPHGWFYPSLNCLQSTALGFGSTLWIF